MLDMTAKISHISCLASFSVMTQYILVHTGRW